MVNYEPFVASDEFSMEGFNNKLSEIVNGFNGEITGLEGRIGGGLIMEPEKPLNLLN